MLQLLKNELPEWAKDARLNLEKVIDLTQLDGLTKEQIVGSALAVAYSLNNKKLIAGLGDLPQDDSLHQAAKLAASLMAMTNIYYRFVHLSDHAELAQVPAGLRMQSMINPGIDKLTFEVMSLAVSILAGCGACINAHNRQLLEHGLPVQSLARIGRIAAVLNAVDVTMKL